MSQQLNKFSNIILGLGGIFCILIFFYAIYKYTLDPRSVIYKYFYISISGFLFFLIALRLKTKTKCLIAVNLFFLGGLLYLLETVLFFMTAPSDTRSKLDIIKEFEGLGINAFPSVAFLESRTQNDTPLYTFSGISKQITVLCYEGDRHGSYLSDKHGFNNPPGSFGKNVEAVLIGDSFTHGVCVSCDETIAGQLKPSIPTALNLGIRGTGPLEQLAIFSEYVKPLKPQTVLWIYTEVNDLASLIDIPKRYPFLLNYFNDNFSQNLMERQEEIDEILLQYVKEERIKQENTENPLMNRFTNNPITKVARLRLLRRSLGFDILDAHPPMPLPTPLFAKILNHVHERVLAWNGKMYFVYLPGWHQYKDFKSIDKEEFTRRGKVLEIVSDLKIPMIDIHLAFKKHPDPLSLFPFRANLHYNTKGYQLVAETILEHLKKDKIQK